MKTVGYIRVSTTMQAERGSSLAEQADRMKSYAHAKDLELLEVLSDEGISGSTLDKREGLQKALTMLEEGEVEALLIVKLDRLTRTLKDLLELVDKYFNNQGYRLISMSDNIDTSSAMGRFSLNLLGSLAQLEREQTAERVSAVMQYKRRNMEHIGGQIPYGFKRTEEDAMKLELSEHEMNAVRLMLAWRRQGLSYRRISKELALLGMVQRNGRPFDPKTLQRILGQADAGFYGEIS